jgi:hypothetical protein
MRIRELAGYSLIGAALITLALLAGAVGTVLLVRQAVIEIRDNVRRRTDAT